MIDQFAEQSRYGEQTRREWLRDNQLMGFEDLQPRHQLRVMRFLSNKGTLCTRLEFYTVMAQCKDSDLACSFETLASSIGYGFAPIKYGATAVVVDNTFFNLLGMLDFRFEGDDVFQPRLSRFSPDSFVDFSMWGEVTRDQKLPMRVLVEVDGFDFDDLLAAHRGFSNSTEPHTQRFLRSVWHDE